MFIAILAGALGSINIFFLRALQIITGPKLSEWLVSPFLYLFLIAGASSAAILQFAYKDGEMSSVSPAYYGMMVLFPALMSYMVFAVPFDIIQALAFAVIVLCVALIAGSEDRLAEVRRQPLRRVS